MQQLKVQLELEDAKELCCDPRAVTKHLTSLESVFQEDPISSI